LAELLQLGKPVVVTMYCAFEGASLTRLFKWPEIEFGPGTLAQSDAMVRYAHGDDLADGHDALGHGQVPQPRILVPFGPNPFAHAPPVDCYSGTTHGVRNAYWIAFTGAAAAGSAPKTEL
jgi:hypothetical protein